MKLFYIIKLIFESLVLIINENPAVITLIFGILAYALSKKTYDNNNAPAILPTEFDTNNHKIKLVNQGKGIAQNIKLETYHCFVSFPESPPQRWRLSFKTIGFLSLNSEVFAEMEEKNEILFKNYFSKYNKEKTPLSITYRNLDGKRYITSLILKEGYFEFIKFGPYPWEALIIREISMFFRYQEIKIKVHLKFYLTKLKKYITSKTKNKITK